MAKNCVAELVMRCFEARTATHLAHLRTKSYAQHMALGGFYEGIIGLVDGFAEAYQGVYGLIDNYPDVDSKETDVIKMLKGLRSWLVSNRSDCCKGQTELENLYDGIIDLIDSTLYKLQYLS